MNQEAAYLAVQIGEAHGQCQPCVDIQGTDQIGNQIADCNAYTGYKLAQTQAVDHAADNFMSDSLEWGLRLRA